LLKRFTPGISGAHEPLRMKDFLIARSLHAFVTLRLRAKFIRALAGFLIAWAFRRGLRRANLREFDPDRKMGIGSPGVATVISSPPPSS
jgi:hypothetical protein